MKFRSETVAAMIDAKIIAVLRIPTAAEVLPACEALVGGGVRVIELTFSTPNVIELLRECRQAFGSQALIGIGSVVTPYQCQSALGAGAEFVVSPVARLGLVSMIHGADRPAILGAFTPTEAQSVHEAGADFIKIFPAETLGPNYIRALKAPLPHLRLLPTGGINEDNLASYLEAGSAVVGVGSTLVCPKLIEKKDWPGLTALARRFVQIAGSR